MTQQIVGIRFQKIGKLYHFDATHVAELAAGDFAVVETARGRQIGQIMGFVEDPPKPRKGSWKQIERKATAHDMVMRQSWEQKQIEAMIECRACLAETKIKGVKIVRAEYSFDGKHLSFLYNSEDDGEVDLSKVRQKMQEKYSEPKIEMRRIGPRDVAKIIGGMGACGLEERCCSKFLTEFSPISIKMAKAQGISLDPSEITGMCGRLRCCLIYEYEQYVEARKVLPKRGKRVVTPVGEGKVIDVLPLKQAVMVRIDDEQRTRAEFLKHEIEPWDELEALRRKSESPCDRHENGGCDCGKAESGDKAQKTDD
ncbi:MAG: stage 0 sporulation family protein [Chloroflexi bacterium]|nr:MAG: stage 0 sporulation family protein [Chloroflexota bacterium]MBL1194773.1 stage 0 sporulation family protein [Chloroflexota bacterium]NOH12065.1 stage 0 sporulation family protein [Chloroflexota bacterium]